MQQRATVGPVRDSHRLKEKYELSLDNRQIVSLTVACLVVLGGVFVLGVVVGKKLAGESVDKAPPADLLSAVDQKTAALKDLEKDASLTFQDELTKKMPSVAVAEPKPEPKPAAEKPADKPPADAKPVEPKPEPVKVAEAPTAISPLPAPAPAPSSNENVVAAIAAASTKPANAPPKLPETPKEEPVATRTHDGGLKEAFGKIAPPAPTSAPPAGTGAWAVQLSAYQDRAEADRFAAGLRDKGYAPYIVEANVAGKGTWYRVRLGRFASKDAANTYLSDFKRETAMNGIVTSN